MVVFDALRRQYPDLPLTIVHSVNQVGGPGCDIRAYAAAGFLGLAPAPQSRGDEYIKRRLYHYPPRKLDGEEGTLEHEVTFAKYAMEWQGHEMVTYVLSGSGEMYELTKSQFVLEPTAASRQARRRGVVVGGGAA